MELTFTDKYLLDAALLLHHLDPDALDRMANSLRDLRDRKGRLFVIGVGGSAATASHAVNDFRKMAGIEAYAPTDNPAEITARTNDNGWETVFVDWLKTSNLTAADGLFVLSVGGGKSHGGPSENIAEAVKYVRKPLGIEKGIGAHIFGIVGPGDGGYVKRFGDDVIQISYPGSGLVTAHTEGIASVVCHLLVSHPRLND